MRKKRIFLLAGRSAGRQPGFPIILWSSGPASAAADDAPAEPRFLPSTLNSIRQVLVAFLLVIASVPCLGQARSEVTIQMPSMLGFNVMDVSRVTPGSPTPFTIQLSNIHLRGPAKTLRLGVRAMAANFNPPSGPALPASLVFWTTGAVQNGVGSGGTLDNTAFRTVFTSVNNPRTAAVNINWNLAAPGPGIRAGAHTLTINWRIEAL